MCVGGGQCRVDCPFPPRRCPADSWRGDVGATACSSRGVCNIATGICKCYRGYVGDACRRCDSQFSVVQGYCVVLPGSLVGVVDTRHSPCDPGHKAFACKPPNVAGFPLSVHVSLAPVPTIAPWSRAVVYVTSVSRVGW